MSATYVNVNHSFAFFFICLNAFYALKCGNIDYSRELRYVYESVPKHITYYTS